ncbi:hypothetical protein OAJ52_04270 [Bacteroidia bacterium]|nr:hypothetical protein [Bacteroidia bacterium]MDB0055058.1 hypothetical protein [Bacteroidia bacterium]MDC0105172.1 hypothetical protein [Bacteroidia bacterium]
MKRLLFRGLLLSLLAIAGGCQEEPILEITETDETSQISLNVVSEILSTFDIVQDWSTGDLLYFKKDESLMPSDVVVSYLDTSFIDGDGIKLGFNFGFLGQSPHGLLCKDGKYRAGYFTVSLNRHPQEIDAKLVIEFPEDNPFYSGDGESMTEISGAMVIKRISDDELKLTTAQLSVIENKEAKRVDATIAIRELADNGYGIVNDQLSFDGTLSVTDNQLTISLATTLPLRKNYTLECAKNIVEGKLNVNISNSISAIDIDFDPDNDAACDNKVSLCINGKTVIYRY